MCRYPPNFFPALLAIGLLPLLFLILMVWRNERVYVFRRGLIEEFGRASVDMRTMRLASEWWDSFPSYDQMMWRFWIPLRSFAKESCADYVRRRTMEEDAANEAK